MRIRWWLGSVLLACPGVGMTQDLQRLVDEALAQRMSVLELPAGVHRLHAPLQIGRVQSSTFTLMSRSGEQVVLKGSVELGPWRTREDGRWEAGVPEGLRPEQLFLNGQRRMRPSWPVDGHLFIQRGVGEQDRFIMDRSDIPDWPNTHGVETVITHNWSISRIPLRSWDRESGEIIMTGSTWHPQHAELKRGQWFRFDNAPLQAMRPGQWRFEPSTRTVVYHPLPGEQPAQTTAEIPKLPVLLELDNAQNVVVRGLTLLHSSYTLPAQGRSVPQAEADLLGAVQIRRSSNVRLEGLLVAGTGGYAISVGEGSRDIEIVGCELVDLGAGGIRIGELDRQLEGDPRLVDSVTVRDNLIASGGRIHPAGVGVLILHSGNNRVVGNTIRDFYYTGISLGWVWGAGWSPARNNLIEGNRIDLIGQSVLSDMGGIYTLGESPGTILRGNVITNVRRARYGGWGIYLDEGSRWILAEGNVAAFTEDSPFHIHYGGDNTIRDNIFAFGANAQMQFSNPVRTGPMLLERNVFLWEDGPLFALEPNDKAVFRGNLYWRETNPQAVVFAQNQNLQRWRAREPDARVQSPGFPDPRALDFGASRPNLPMRSVSERLRALPPILRTFLPAPPPMRLVLKEDFEQAPLGLAPPGWAAHFGGERSRALVVDEEAASGRHSLRFTDGEEGEPWMPHIYAEGYFGPGRMSSTFKLKIRPGAAMLFEWRDTSPWYTTGPVVEVDSQGRISSRGVEVARIDPDTWVEIALEAEPGSPHFTLRVFAPGRSLVERTFPLSPEFQALQWVGFISSGIPGSVFFVDDIYVGPVSSMPPRASVQ